MAVPGDPGPVSEADVPDILAALFGGQPGAEDRLCRVLRGPVQQAVWSFLGRDNLESDDVVQESLVAVLGFLRRRGEFEGNLFRLAVTIARNRCRNILNWRSRRPQVAIEPLAEWIASSSRSPLDAFVDDEILQVMRAALARLGGECRRLLSALFLQSRSAEEMRLELRLKSIRAVYYRREACLETLHDGMNETLGGSS